jgi:hypothetical protein
VSETEDLGLNPNGSHLFRKPNGVGGYVYISDEIGGGVVVWDTALVSEATLLAALVSEHHRFYIECQDKRRSRPPMANIDNVAVINSLAILDRSIDDIRGGNTQSAKLAIQELADSLSLQLPRKNDNA